MNFIISLLKQNYITKNVPYINVDSPSFRMTSNINNHQRYGYIILIADFMSFINTKEDRIFLLKWCLEELLTSEPDTLYQYSYIFSY